MNFFDLAKHRYSSRDYLNKPIEEEKLLQVLEAGRIAPSAANRQPWHFIIVREKENLVKVKNCYMKPWIKSAPVVIVVCGDHSVSWKRDDGKDHCDVDIAIATDHMTLAATELGLATCWVCKFDAMKCKQLLGLPDHIEPIVLLPVGYPADKPDINRHKTARKKPNEIIHVERYEK